MKEELINMGFVESDKNPDFLEKYFGQFDISLCISGKYFMLGINPRSYDEECIYPFISLEKFEQLIKANQEYFKDYVQPVK